MTAVTGWELLFRRDDISTHEVREVTATALEPGQARLAVERFGITTNIATYARFGDSPLRFFDAFPAPAGHARTPVWGFARVVESQTDSLAPGSRVFGYLPLASHHVVTPEPAGTGFLDTTAGRVFAHDWYRTFEAAPEDPGDDLKAVLHPVFPASFAVAEVLTAGPPATVVLTSASSKTMAGLAALLTRHGGFRTVGITAAEHAGFVRGLGHYDEVLTYDQTTPEGGEGPVVLVDGTNSPERIEAVRHRYADRLERGYLLGFTHPRTSFDPPVGTGPVPELVFTPALEQQLEAAQGAQTYRARRDEAETWFRAGAADWLTVTRGSGPAAASSALMTVLAGKQPPDIAEVLTP